MGCNHTKQSRKYSHDWQYPGHYPGYHCHPNESDGAYCIDTENVDCSSIFYSYIDGCKKYPYDLMNLDKTIDMMVNPSTTFYDLND